MGVLHGTRVARRLSLLPAVLILADPYCLRRAGADGSGAQFSNVSGQAFTGAEFQSILKAVKNC